MPPPVVDAALRDAPLNGGVAAVAPPAGGMAARALLALRRFAAFAGPGYLVAVGYLDPGNWATDLAGGSAYGYALLWVVLLANAMAIVLQVLAARLGLVTGLDLAQTSRARSSRRSAVAQWLLCELAICATDLAEVIGMAIALKLLFGVPLALGVPLTALDAVALLMLQQRGMRALEALIVVLVGTVCVCLGLTAWWAQPPWGAVAQGLLPQPALFGDAQALFVAVGIVGATVMPHNLYLHSSLVQRRLPALRDAGLRTRALRLATADTVVALSLAFVVNATILVTAAAVFHGRGLGPVDDLQQACRLMSPVLGTAAASTVFAAALLAAGQSSTLTATLAGQVVMEGFVAFRMAPWKRRLVTRAVAVLPAWAAIAIGGEGATGPLLVASQVVLSLQLPFALVPLVRTTSDARWMGPYVNPRWLTKLAWAIGALIVGFNLALLWQGVARL